MRDILKIVFIMAVNLCVIGLNCPSEHQQAVLNTIDGKVITEEKQEPKKAIKEVMDIEDIRPKPKRLVYDLTETEKSLLMGIAMSEAGNQDIKGKALVMNVVLNRCKKHNGSIYGIIYSPNQFSTKYMCSGDYGCEVALRLVMYGYDESQGALWFSSTGYPRYGQPLFKHGGHWFSG